jgi:cellulose synthase/poly-beta-1,6-N-acetylglucosamine synthase-like glycosyltransferase
LYELILVDNHSTDDSLEIANQSKVPHPRTQIVDLSEFLPVHQAFKKEALTQGISLSGGSIMLTTDADCQVPKTWISSIVNHLVTTSCQLVTGPVMISHPCNLIGQYQQLDLCGLMVATGGGLQNQYLLMANGANLAFYKSKFYELGGYGDARSLSSGDDVLLIHKFYRNHPESVGFIKDERAVVLTQSLPDLTSFINQRHRWASKAAHYHHLPTKIVALIVFVNSSLLFIHLITGIFWNMTYLWIFLAHLLIKIIADSILLHTGISFFKIPFNWRQWIGAHLFNPVINVIIPLQTMMVKSYPWKGRTTS